MQSKTFTTVITEHSSWEDNKWVPTHRIETTEETVSGDDS